MELLSLILALPPYRLKISAEQDNKGWAPSNSGISFNGFILISSSNPAFFFEQFKSYIKQVFHLVLEGFMKGFKMES